MHLKCVTHASTFNHRMLHCVLATRVTSRYHGSLTFVHPMFVSFIISQSLCSQPEPSNASSWDIHTFKKDMNNTLLILSGPTCMPLSPFLIDSFLPISTQDVHLVQSPIYVIHLYSKIPQKDSKGQSLSYEDKENTQIPVLCC